MSLPGPGLERRLTGLLGAVLAGVVLYAGMKLMDPATPALIAAGLMVCAGTPLVFLLRLKKPATKEHPVIVSSLCGLGCVMIMVGVQRYGDEHQPLLAVALLVLIGWMLYQRRIWRASGSRD